MANFGLLRRWVELKTFFSGEKRNERFLILGAVLLFVFLIVQMLSVLIGGGAPPSTFKLIPSNAHMIVEIPDIRTAANKADSSNLWQGLTEIEAFSEVRQRFHFLDTMNSDSTNFQEFAEGKKLFVSLHTISRDEFSFLLFLPLSDTDQGRFHNLLNAFLERNNYVLNTRLYKEQVIFEFSPKGKSTVLFAFMLYEKHFIGSYSPLLIEDVIRRAIEDEGESFTESRKQLIKMNKTDRDDADIYLNGQNIHELFSLFASDETSARLKFLNTLCKGVHWDVLASNNRLALKGEALHSPDQNDDYFALFRGQNPTTFQELQYYLPRQTASLLRLGLSKPSKYFDRLESYMKKYESELLDKREALVTDYSFSSASFYSALSGEIALASLEGSKKSDKLLFLRLQDPEAALSVLERAAQNAASFSQKDKAETSAYGDLKITRVEIPEMPAALFGAFFKGFDESYYTLIDDKYLVIANRSKALELLADEIEDEQVWAKLVRRQQFFENFDERANLNFIVHFPRAWSGMSSGLYPGWKQFFEKHKQTFLQYEFLGIRFEAGKKKSVLNTVLEKGNLVTRVQSKKKTDDFNVLSKGRLQTGTTHTPHVVRNHIDKSREMVVQDGANHIYLISDDGKTVWERPLGSPLVSDVFQVDYFKNGKLQYLMATASRVYLFDRTGRLMDNFPISLHEGNDIAQLSVIDYDKTKQYRFAVTDTEGNIFLYNKQGYNLKGWRPFRTGSALASPLRHLRVGNKDFLIAIEKNGTANVIKRNASEYPNFPKQFSDTQFDGDYFISKKSGIEQTTVELLSTSGEFVAFSPSGKVKNLKTYYSPGKDAHFGMCIDAVKKNHWLVSRQYGRDLALLRPDEKVVFQKRFNTSAPKIVQYYDFGGNNEIVIVSDPSEKRTYIYHISGELIHHKPIKSNGAVGLTYSESQREFRVYRAFGNSADVLTFYR